MCNVPTDFLQLCRGSTNIFILAKTIEKGWRWLKCDIFKTLAIFFLIFDMLTHFLVKDFSWLKLTQSRIHAI